jgi:hypothetical protein
MAKRIDKNVTLGHGTASLVAKLLSDYASEQERHAKKTRSEPVRWLCSRQAIQAREIADEITDRLWEWIEN